jgi:hypothetical protein
VEVYDFSAAQKLEIMIIKVDFLQGCIATKIREHAKIRVAKKRLSPSPCARSELAALAADSNEWFAYAFAGRCGKNKLVLKTGLPD